jgi:CheY-like chemotaxis protein
MTTVLVVDDESLIAMALQAALEDENYRVITAANGRQGLERLADTRADIVLLDMMMPVMNGPAMLEAMAADPKLRDIPVIVMSSLPEATIRTQAKAATMILQKPYTAKDVLQAVARGLEQAGQIEKLNFEGARDSQL